MEKTPRDDKTKMKDPRTSPRGPNLWLLIMIMAVLGLIFFMQTSPPRSTIAYDYFLEQVEDGNVVSVEIGQVWTTGVFDEPPYPQPKPRSESDEKAEEDAPKRLEKHFRVRVPPEDTERAKLYALLKTQGTQTEVEPPDNSALFFYLIPLFVMIGLLFFFWLSYRRTRDQIMGGGFLSGFSKSPAKRYEGTPQSVTFDDVAGLEGVKADLMEVVEYLKQPLKFQRLGGRVPKGVLLNGPPGTGKTLLARAVAGEAGVPYFSVSGSEFIQMFVGVGASRVRDLFKTAKDNAPAIIFIDEIDAVGRQRGAGLGGGHDEREQTLNQILSEMDGFTPSDSVIILAATNRPDVLDPALLRPGRFDRHVTVGRPTHKGRKAIFQVHVRNVPLADDVDLDRMAANTVGLTGADIRNIVNEAALWAARHDKHRVEMEDFDYARDKVLMGAKREEVLQDEEKEKTAYHEAGHCLMGWLLPGAHRVHKVTIIPRGRSLGSTQTMPSEDRLSMSERELRDHLTVLLGGRAAEKLVYDETTVGAENDLERASGLARRMVTHWGMSEQLGPVSYKLADDDPFLGREIHQHRQFSEHTMELIDTEVKRILMEASERCTGLLQEHREMLETLAQELLKREELQEKEITELIGPSVHELRDKNGKPPSGATSVAPQVPRAETRDAVSEGMSESDPAPGESSSGH